MKDIYAKEPEVEKPKDLDAWMNDVQLGAAALPDGKGVVGAIHPPVTVDTRFGMRKKSQVVINGSDGSTINIQLFLPQNFPMVHEKSNLAKILKYYGCTGLKDLIGKEVEVVKQGEFWKLKEQ